MGQKGTGRRLSDQERMEIITKLEGDKPRASAAECARQYGVSSAAITKLMKMKDKIKQRFQENNAFSQQRKRGGTERHLAFEDELFQWIGLQQQLHAQEQQQQQQLQQQQEQQQTELPSPPSTSTPLLTSAKVQEKAQELLKAHNLGSFRASKGWYYRFCRRYGLSKSSLGGAGADHQEDAGGDERGGLDGASGSESDSSTVEHTIKQDTAGITDTSSSSSVAVVNAPAKTESKKRKESASLGRDGKKPKGPSVSASGNGKSWGGVDSLQDTLARAAMALDHPDARGYLGENAAGEMLRSIQQSIGVVQCIRLKKTIALDGAAASTTTTENTTAAVHVATTTPVDAAAVPPTAVLMTRSEDVVV